VPVTSAKQKLRKIESRTKETRFFFMWRGGKVIQISKVYGNFADGNEVNNEDSKRPTIPATTDSTGRAPAAGLQI
jgi:hypothetical protein